MPTLDNTFLGNNNEFKGIRILAFLLLIASTSFVTISSGFAVGMLEENKKEQTLLSPYGISQAQSDEVESNANVPATISHHEGAMQVPTLDTVHLPQHLTPTGPVDASDVTLEQNPEGANSLVSQRTPSEIANQQQQQEQFQAPVVIPESSLQQQLPALPPPADIANQQQQQQEQPQQFQAPVVIPESSLQQQLPALPPPADIANQQQQQQEQPQQFQAPVAIPESSLEIINDTNPTSFATVTEDNHLVSKQVVEERKGAEVEQTWPILGPAGDSPLTTTEKDNRIPLEPTVRKPDNQQVAAEQAKEGRESNSILESSDYRPMQQPTSLEQQENKTTRKTNDAIKLSIDKRPEAEIGRSTPQSTTDLNYTRGVVNDTNTIPLPTVVNDTNTIPLPTVVNDTNTIP
jgi:hypothetical protein